MVAVDVEGAAGAALNFRIPEAFHLDDRANFGALKSSAIARDALRARAPTHIRPHFALAGVRVAPLGDLLQPVARHLADVPLRVLTAVAGAEPIGKVRQMLDCNRRSRPQLSGAHFAYASDNLLDVFRATKCRQNRLHNSPRRTRNTRRPTSLWAHFSGSRLQRRWAAAAARALAAWPRSPTMQRRFCSSPSAAYQTLFD